ncbi:prolyl 4-hydroxylase subunit alpha-2 [Dorcoceras hygrometricum]|uniref:Prolyl 4-hydroxylase subunit alpha-2 n=1 Tax=Dorcoceras hygrometricum TaxID=472368 RepID=A0A2Z7B235_9LAMI|nr:prolyl 4-hydroxylase subunit alpha-2 [Dorcoceras hygrometricum]
MSARGESSTPKHRLLHASGPHPISPPNDPKPGNVQYNSIITQYEPFIGCLVSYLAGVLASGSDQFHEETGTSRVFSQLPCWRLGVWLRPVSRGNRHFTVGDGRLCQSGPRSEGRLLHQPALEGLTRSARMYSPRKVGRSNSGEGRRRRRMVGTAAAAASRGGRRPRDFGARVRVVVDTASRGPTTIVAPESQFRTCPSDHGKSV